jgi:hypothetical protein
LFTEDPFFRGNVAAIVLATAPVLQIAALLITTATPIRSTGFHLLSTASGMALYISISLAWCYVHVTHWFSWDSMDW